MNLLTTGAGLGLAALLTGQTHAQTITTLVLEGDSVPGVGLVTTVGNLDVNNNGDWVVEVDTDNANSDADNAIIANGVLVYQEDQGLTMPAGSRLDTFGSMNLNEANVFSSNWGLDGTAGTSDDSGLYWNGVLLVQEGDVSTASGFGPGTTYRGYFNTYNTDNDVFIALCSMDDPAIATTVDRAIMIYGHDGSGALVSESLYLKETDIPAGQTEGVDDFETGPHDLDYNQNGDIAYIVDLAGDSAFNSAIYVNSAIIAQEGDDSGVVPGTLWDDLGSGVLDVNNWGQIAYKGDLDTGDTATDGVLVFDGNIVAREGDGHPDIPAGTVFTSFGSGPILCSDNGDTVWYGDWNESDTDIDTGLFINDQLVIQEGVTMIGGLTVDTVRGITEGFRMSDDGRYVILELVMEGSLEGAFLIDRGPGAEVICVGDGTTDIGGGPIPCPCGNESALGSGEGCANSTGVGATLAAIGSLTVAGADTTFFAAQARPSQPGLLVQGASLIGTPFKDGILCMGGPTERVENAFTDGAGEAMTVGDIASLGHVSPGQTRYYQFWYRDPAVSPCGTGSNLSQGLKVDWQ